MDHPLRVYTWIKNKVWCTVIQPMYIQPAVARDFKVSIFDTADNRPKGRHVTTYLRFNI